MYKWKFK
jgi:hypothetical protein